ncbi:MAG: winged helix-turn-helix transcriptional regulator [Planctomycetia bacterium]|nr:winged helix-turn-helix transcriptional regulator [Planctomycetia bacterium]
MSAKVAAVKAQRPKSTGKTKPILRISDKTIDDLKDVFSLLADRSRLKILLALLQEGEMHVTALCDLLGYSQPAVSHHLTLMKKELVAYRRDGKHNYYHIDAEKLCHTLEQFFAASGNGQQLQMPGFCLAYKSNGHGKKR